MKKLLALLVTMGMIASNSFAAFDAFSFRMQGINPFLAGIIADEFTDVRAGNVADILNISGYRFYTQFANLSGKGDQLFNDAGTGLGGTVDNDAFQFGFFGNPLKKIVLPDGQMGLLFEQASSIAPGNAGGFGGADSGEASEHTVVNIDNSIPGDNDFNDAGDATVTTDRTGERYVETGNNDITVYVGNPIGDRLKIGIGAEMNITTSEEPINATYDAVTTVVSGTAKDIENNSQEAKEEINASQTQLNIGLRYEMSDQWDIGGALIYTPQTTEQKRSATVIFNRDVSAGAGAQPTTFTATGTDGADILAALGGLPPHIPQNDTTEILTGFAWSDNTAFVDGIGMDNDAVGKLEDDGAGITTGVDSHYKLNENLTLAGHLTYINTPLDRKLDAEKTVTATVRSWTALSFNDVLTVGNKTTYKGSGDNKTTGLGAAFGAEHNLPGNVKLGYGVFYSLVTNGVDMNYTVSSTDVTTYDATNDGLKFGAGTPAGDLRTTVTETDKYTSNDETKTTVYAFPIGLELQLLKKLKVRLGVTHIVAQVVEKTRSKQIEDGLQVSYNEAGNAAPTTTYAGGAANTGDVAVYTETTEKTRITQYFYGAGYQWNENLSFDILNFSGAGSGGGLLDLASWRISATLLF